MGLRKLGAAMGAVVVAAMALTVSAPAMADKDGHGWGKSHHGKYVNYKKRKHAKGLNVQLGPRPFYLVDQMSPGKLKNVLAQCAATKKTYVKADFSIGHRGAPLQFPEHTKEAYTAGARMGAGIMECDVTFTKDKELVCRHSQCDLHTTTNILDTPLAAQCGTSLTPNNPARCCTSDLTLAEFKTLKGKMDAPGPTANWRTDLYATGATLLTHKESIRLFKKLGLKMTPELKSPSVQMPFDGFTQEDYAQKMIDEYKDEGVSPRNVWAQSFNLDDVLYWVQNERRFGRQAVFLEGRYSIPGAIDKNDPSDENLTPNMQELADMGVKVVAPPMWILVKSKNGKIVPSKYAKAAKKAGLKIISWTTERSGRIVEEVIPASGAFYYDSTVDVLENDGDIMKTIDVLARKVGIIGLFSDWPATTTFYANCMKLK